MMSQVSSRAPQRRSSPTFRPRWFAPAALALLGTLVILAGCASGNTTAKTGNTTNKTGGTTSPTATTAPTAPTATPLSSVPQITAAYCQGLVSISDVNNVMKPASAATTIVPDNARPGGSCSYTASAGALDFTLYFQPIPAGTSLNAIAQQAWADAKAKNNIPSSVTVTITPVSGVGDQAIYASFSGTVSGISGYWGELYTTKGSVLLSCFNFGIGSTPTTPQQPALTQLCTQAVGRM
ncbi:MAG TPA: hypothetical protein VGR88_06425 [Ktedonobacterales bacterium]|nr:hypothetical protein [Ktedonobacterales bacterium]